MFSGIETLMLIGFILIGSLIRIIGSKQNKGLFWSVVYEALIIAGVCIITVNFICRLDVRFENFQACSTVGFILGYIGVRAFDKFKEKFFNK